MDQMLGHCRAVRAGAPETFIVGDMPYMSYQVSDEQAVINAGRFIQEARADCVKLEGGGGLSARASKPSAAPASLSWATSASLAAFRHVRRI
jgi:3-methyl-2-oxobutanoate hydroxymethyltransferase